MHDKPAPQLLIPRPVIAVLDRDTSPAYTYMKNGDPARCSVLSLTFKG